MNSGRRRMVLGCVLVVAGALRAAAGDWPNFRGPNHDGISRETEFRKNWDGPIPLVWERTIGSAFSGLTCVEGRVYTCGTVDDRQTMFCLNAETGDVIWQRPFEEEYVERQGGDGTRATPAYDDGRVYILGALGTLVCYQARDGKELWKRKLEGRPKWGFSGSVLIEGDMAVVPAGRRSGGILALNKVSGETVWSCGEDVAGYATPYPFEFHGKRYICVFMGKAAIIVEARSGREVWRTDWHTDWDVNAAAPIFHDGYLFLSSGYRTGSGLFKLSPDGDRLKGESVWKSDVLKNKFQSAVLLDGHLYCSDEQGLRCVEFLTGRPAWKLARIGDGPRATNGTIVAADGHLLYLGENGDFIIARASPEKFEPLTKAEILSGRCWTVPTLYKGRLYARDLTRLVCFDLRGK